MLKIGLGYQVLLAVILGIAVGLFFGPICSVFEPIGTTFVMLLQMVVLPYIPTLLMHGLGSLSPETAKKLFTRGWLFLFLLWVLVLGTIYALSVLIPTPLPDPSSDFAKEPVSFAKDFLSYIIPQNPFYDLSHNVIPAIALFSMIMGVALMHLKVKEPLLGLLERTNMALERIFKWLAIVSPIGIFAHIANAMGTVNLSDLSKLELYVVVFYLTSIFLSVWVLPMIVSCLTSIKYRDLLKEYRIVCMLAFATGIPSIAFPFINNCMRRLAEKKNLDLATFRSTSQTVVPLAYSFAQIGNFFLLFFIFFLSFYYRHPLSVKEAVMTTLFTIPISFGTPQLSLAGMSFLVETLSFPQDAFNLFAETIAITLNFQVLMSVSAMLTFIILVLLRYYGLLEINWRKLSLQLSTMVVVLLGAIAIGRQFVHIEDNYRDMYLSLRIQEILENPPQATILSERTPHPVDLTPEAFARVLKTGALRVGYDPNNIPFCYFNKWNELVGYDIAYAYQLAKDIDVRVEFVPLQYPLLGKDLDTGYFDIAMSAIVLDDQRLLDMDFTHVYENQPNALVVPICDLSRFRNLDDVIAMHNLKIGAGGAYSVVAKNHFPHAQIISVDSDDAILTGKIEVNLWSQLPAYIWCVGHPEYTTLVYNKQLGSRYFAYPVRTGSQDFVSFINHWMALKAQSGFRKTQTDYWIHGKRLASKEPRWSIIRNLLHWID